MPREDRRQHQREAVHRGAHEQGQHAEPDDFQRQRDRARQRRTRSTRRAAPVFRAWSRAQPGAQRDVEGRGGRRWLSGAQRRQKHRAAADDDVQRGGDEERARDAKPGISTARRQACRQSRRRRCCRTACRPARRATLVRNVDALMTSGSVAPISVVGTMSRTAPRSPAAPRSAPTATLAATDRSRHTAAAAIQAAAGVASAVTPIRLSVTPNHFRG